MLTMIWVFSRLIQSHDRIGAIALGYAVYNPMMQRNNLAQNPAMPGPKKRF